MKGLSFYALLLVVLLFAVVLSSSDEKRGDAYGYKQFLNDLEGNQIRYIQIKPNAEVPTGSVKVDFIDNSSRTFFVSNTNQVELDVREYNIDREMLDVPRPNWLLSLLPSIIALGVVIFLFFFIMNQAQGGGGGSRVMNFGKSRAKMVVDDKKTITFKNVAGLDEEKEELEELVEFLKSPRKFVELGARIPKGVLLVGPPGTGKTLLAKAVAGEAGVPFFSISGSDFVEMFVGVGASRVRDLFEQAKKNSPCIIFIDEIDAVGRKRGAGLGGGHDEREQTLNQLLVEMDGFGINEGVIVVAATNRVDILDPALLRPGRFDRKVVVGRPDAKGREEILKVHGKGKPLSDDVDFRAIARSTSGFTGADLENLLNEAAIFAARENKKVIEQEDIHRAFIKVGIGTEKKSRVITEKEKKITAYHEAGHAIMHEILSEIDPVHSISIIPTGFAGGYTMSIPAEDTYYETKTKMEQEIIALLGGRAAEKLVLDDITTGASNDIERATKIASGMVTKFGMSDVLGPIQFGDNNEEVFIGRDWGHTRNYGENIAGLIDSEIKGIIDSSYNKAIKILNENIEVLHKTAEVLLEKEKISGIEFKALFNEFSPSI
ncbi:ATP-dependent zinc metalloprotease FtsH [Natranaerovirga pectinivora]|nr:ATP-dependent zinc metalloprotease FtsH [Natranaerovirga pectinivora]